jgi:hypothetical protein
MPVSGEGTLAGDTASHEVDAEASSLTVGDSKLPAFLIFFLPLQEHQGCSYAEMLSAFSWLQPIS